jgi:hypothetical protein
MQIGRLHRKVNTAVKCHCINEHINLKKPFLLLPSLQWYRVSRKVDLGAGHVYLSPQMLVEIPEVGVEVVPVPVQRIVLHLQVVPGKIARRISASYFSFHLGDIWQ